jgi:hypothetical protein
MRLAAAAAIVALCVGCAAAAGKPAAESAVADVHAKLDAEHYAEIYAGADDLFKGASTETKFTELLVAIHRKLGTVTKSDQTSWFANSQVGTSGPAAM